MTESDALRLFAEGGLAGALVWVAWRISERLSDLAAAFAGCAAKMDTLISLLRKGE